MPRQRVTTVSVSKKEQHVLDVALRARRLRLDAKQEEWTASARFAESQHRASRRLVTNGLGVTYPGPGCVKGTASYSLDASIDLTQASAAGPPFSDSSPALRIAEERYDSGDQSPLGGGVIFTGTRLDDSTPVTFPNQFPVRGNVPVLVSIRALLSVLVAHGEAELNFKDRGFQLNIPFVYLMLF